MHPHFSAMDQFRCLQLLSYDPASMTVPDRGARAGASETLRGAARHVLEPVLKGDVHGFSMFFGWTLHVLASNSCGKPKRKPIADGLYKRYEWICAVILGMVLMIGLRWSSAEAEIAGNDSCPSSHEESWTNGKATHQQIQDFILTKQQRAHVVLLGMDSTWLNSD